MALRPINGPLNIQYLPTNGIIVLKKVNGIWPGTPTARADTVIMWKGPDPSPPEVSSRTLGEPGMLVDVDIRLIVEEED